MGVVTKERGATNLRVGVGFFTGGVAEEDAVEVERFCCTVLSDDCADVGETVFCAPCFCFTPAAVVACFDTPPEFIGLVTTFRVCCGTENFDLSSDFPVTIGCFSLEVDGPF